MLWPISHKCMHTLADCDSLQQLNSKSTKKKRIFGMLSRVAIKATCARIGQEDVLVRLESTVAKLPLARLRMHGSVDVAFNPMN
jgi:hypothetical protein